MLALKASYEAFELEEQRWAAGLDNWIERGPNDGRAYLERSGTYYHLHRYERSSADAKRAMELGTPGAERDYRQTQALL
ncbi:MAG: hypothetical protein MI794_19175 [Pseudomonadales bacterium]|nr:hypothetical protein [Pseudomonadales bacterium]